MTNTLEVMKCSITNALELEAKATSAVMRSYYRGKVMGVLEVAIAILSRTEHDKIRAHYKSEEERLL